MSLKRNKNGMIIVLKGETHKAKERRLKEGWFEKYAPVDKVGIDIGSSDDTIHPTFRRWDIDLGDTDGTYLAGIEPESFYTVYASHILEHIKYPRAAIRRWYEVLKPSGHLIILVPHRDLYEQKIELPSQWNGNHEHFWLPDEEDKSSFATLSLKKEVLKVIPDADIVSLRVLDEGYEPNSGPYNHPIGELSIEIIIKKR